MYNENTSRSFNIFHYKRAVNIVFSLSALKPIELRNINLWYICKKLIFTIILLSSNPIYSYEKTVKIGAGVITGVYYPVAIELCKIIDTSSSGMVKCEVLPTRGSAENIYLLNKGTIDFAIAQSDTLNEAYLGEQDFGNGVRVENIRKVASLFNEVFTIIVRKDDGIYTLEDLKRKKILSTSLSGSNFPLPLELLADFYVWNQIEYPQFIEGDFGDAESALCDKIIDAVMLTIAHPNGFLRDIAQKCEISFLGLDSRLIHYIISKRPYYFTTHVPQGLYSSINYDTNSIGTKAVLVTHNSVRTEIVRLLLQGLLKKNRLTENSITVSHKLDLCNNLDKNSSIPLHIESQKLLDSCSLP